ncbi:MAG: hypothetical protein ISN26_02425 [Betaproteobacteria bacterium AqS2]|uniref:Uncharacterized protein n=1 Tax=Candidatus Amphirhobacter heronislandensis TaxID=1732024 RepID=A0A930Y134_9GAMM|nr:hypothetical protein [Betaproteobacteria bacterium AqS2]
MEKEESGPAKTSNRKAARLSIGLDLLKSRSGFSESEQPLESRSSFGESEQYLSEDGIHREFKTSIATAMRFERLPVKILVYIPFLLLCYYYLHPSGLSLDAGLQAILQGITAALLSDIVLEAVRKIPHYELRAGVSSFVTWAFMAAMIISLATLMLGIKPLWTTVIVAFLLLAIADRVILFMIMTLWMLSKFYLLLYVDDEVYPYFVWVLFSLIGVAFWLMLSTALFQKSRFKFWQYLLLRLAILVILTNWTVKTYTAIIYAGHEKQIYIGAALLFFFSVVAWIFFGLFPKKENPIWERILVMLGAGGAVFALQFAV